MENYAESTRIRPAILAIAGGIPLVGGIVGGADAAIMARVETERRERLNTLIEALEDGLEDFAGPIDIFRADPVLHAAYVTIEATLRTSRREKIRAFSKLLLAGVEDPPRIDLAEEYEDYLKILDELSMRELRLLALLAEFETSHPKVDGQNDLQRTNQYWAKFEAAAHTRLGIPSEELSGLLARLIRSGTFEPIVGAYWGYEGGQGILTGAYFRLATLIQVEPTTFDTGTIV